MTRELAADRINADETIVEPDERAIDAAAAASRFVNSLRGFGRLAAQRDSLFDFPKPACDACPTGLTATTRLPDIDARAGCGLFVIRWRVSHYTNGMKTAISLPDAVFLAAERQARRARKSRSQLCRSLGTRAHRMVEVTQGEVWWAELPMPWVRRPDSVGRSSSFRATH